MKPGKLFFFLWVGCLPATAEQIHEISIRPLAEKNLSAEAKGYVSLSDGALSLGLPLSFLDSARIIASEFTVLVDEGRHFSVRTHTSDDWGNPDIRMSDMPRMLIERDFEKVKDEVFKGDLEATRRAIIGDDTAFLGVARRLDRIAYLVFDTGRATVLVADTQKPDCFSQITVFGMSRREVEEIFIKGALR